MKESYTHAIAAGMLEVDGVPGSYAVPNSPTDGLAITWGTHRYFKGNAQRVMILVSRFTKPRALKIIRSPKFAPSDQK